MLRDRPGVSGKLPAECLASLHTCEMSKNQPGGDILGRRQGCKERYDTLRSTAGSLVLWEQSYGAGEIYRQVRAEGTCSDLQFSVLLNFSVADRSNRGRKESRAAGHCGISYVTKAAKPLKSIWRETTSSVALGCRNWHGVWQSLG